jgi:antitoxin component YwqK of YwqJK toxin-antitoxin module
MISYIGNSQEINQFDDQERRHGKWLKKFEGTEQTRYEGVFSHGQETGTFKFYNYTDDKAKKHYLFATKTYSETSELVDVKYFIPEGKVLSEGQLKNKQRVGKWVYYHPGTDKTMKVEHYENGVLEGTQTTYFENGNITKTEEYKNGNLDGITKVYNNDGKLRRLMTYQNGELNGPAKFYDIDGNLVAEGNYKNNKQNGIWKTYENGEVVKTEKF